MGGSQAERGEFKDAAALKSRWIVGAAPSGTATKKRPTTPVVAGSQERSRARAPTEGRHPRSFGTAYSSRNAGKSGLGSMDHTEPRLRQRDGAPKGERDVRGSIAHGRSRAKTPLRKPSDSAEARMRVVKRHPPRAQAREPRARVQSFEVGRWQISVGHIARSRALEKETSRDARGS